MLIIITFLLVHWYVSAFCQSFFLHRYGAHAMFTMPRFWDRFFYLLTYFAQGSSFLNPRAYALLHRRHHKHSDTEKDPHSPHFFKDVFRMMWNTRKVYHELRIGLDKNQTEEVKDLPTWPLLDRIGSSYFSVFAWMAFYTAFYIHFAPNAWWYLLLPIHFLIGPIHGAFVNWCGHKYGYANYDNHDYSKNTFVLDFLIMGECFQNNHHQFPNSPNFAKRWFEIDLTYPMIRMMNKLHILRLTPAAINSL
jgi:stearoyl-CoA desaturase (delta-9 desaturase)